ncbi:class I SAM-dependent methyltransferase [Verrucomicrobiota bacterium]
MKGGAGHIPARLGEALTWRLPWWRRWLVSRASLLAGSALGLPGARFGWFGFGCGRRCVSEALVELAQPLYSTPVNCTRYMEFDFARRLLPRAVTGECLDVSSPRLFSAYMLSRRPELRVSVVNPDGEDLAITRTLFRCLELDPGRTTFEARYAGDLPWPDEHFECVWSLSVIEHIPVPEDITAVREMWRVLSPGGRLILTLPAAASGYDEFRAENVYGLDRQEHRTEEGVFFQRWYAEKDIGDRIVTALPGARITRREVWGEKARGWFADYCRRWAEQGDAVSAADPFYAATRFRRYAGIDELPGAGIACLALAKQGERP